MEELLRRLSIKQLRLIIEISAEGNLVSAARNLNMTQSAVTKSLRDIEETIRIKLFERTNRGVIANLYGTKLTEHAKIIMHQIGHAADEISDLVDGKGGRVAIGTLLAASAGLLPTAIAGMHRERPRIMVSVVEGTNDFLMPAVRLGDIDLVVGRLPEFRIHEDLRQEKLFMDCACVVARRNHPMLGRAGITLADLAEADWILPSRDTTLRRQIDKAFRDNRIEAPRNPIESVSILTNMSLILKSDYLLVWPWQVASQYLDLGVIDIAPILLESTIGPIGITTRRDSKLSPAAETLIEELRRISQQLPACPFMT